MNHLLFLYNPTSGKGGAAGHLSPILDTLTKEGWLVTAYPTQQPGDATRIVRELGSQFDRVVCCGGDGTLSETAAGLMALESPPVLGYIPAGSTNDCATTLHIPRVYKKAAALAGSDIPPLAWDIGTLNERPFVYVAAFGAFTEVAYDTPQDLKNTFGHLAYVMAGIASIPSSAPSRARSTATRRQHPGGRLLLRHGVQHLFRWRHEKPAHRPGGVGRRTFRGHSGEKAGEHF